MLRCECIEITRVTESALLHYDPITEAPFVNHDPGECKCTNDLRRYYKSPGSTETIILCSCCWLGQQEYTR
jgi:hypothetical protein